MPLLRHLHLAIHGPSVVWLSPMAFGAPWDTYPQKVADDNPAAARGPFAILRQNGRMGRLAAAVLASSVGDPFSQVVSLVLLFQATHAPIAIAGAYGAEMVGVLTVGSLLGAATDRLDRRRLIVGLEVMRVLVVASLPVVTTVSVFLLYPALLVLAGVETLVQPSRQAAVPELVEPGEVGAANALIMTALTLAQAVGFAAAGVAMLRLSDPRPLYLIDAFTFAVACLLIASLGSLGGGIAEGRLRGGASRAWRVPGARPLLAVAAATVVFVGMLNPTLLPAAYALSSNGPTAYTLFQLCLITGGLAGSMVAGRVRRPSRMLAHGFALWIFGIGVLGVGLSQSFLVAGVAVAVSGLGNAMYSVTNTSALMEKATSTNRGTVMSARFTVTRTATAVGLAGGAAITSWLGPLRAFSSFGVGLLVVAGGFSAFWALQARRPPAAREDPS